MKSHLSILSLSCWVVGVLLRKTLLVCIVFMVVPVLSCTNCKVSGLILRSLIHFELILVQGDKHGSSFSFLQAGRHFSPQHLLKRLSFLHHAFWCFWQKVYKNHQQKKSVSESRKVGGNKLIYEHQQFPFLKTRENV
jgi:hypothetical protein